MFGSFVSFMDVRLTYKFHDRNGIASVVSGGWGGGSWLLSRGKVAGVCVMK